VRRHDQTFWCLHDGEFLLDDMAAQHSYYPTFAQNLRVSIFEKLV